MAPAIGTFSVQYGTEKQDLKQSVDSGVAYFAGWGDDSIFLSGIGNLNLGGQRWWIPALASGGRGSDSYYVPYGTSTFIYDASTSAGDLLRIYDYADNIVEFFSIEQRSLFIQTSFGTNLVIVDALNDNGAIETVQFSDVTFSGVAASAQSLLSTYKTRPDQSIDALIASGLFNPKVMGVGSAQDVRDIISTINSYNNPEASPADALSLNSKTMQLLYVAYYGRPADAGGLQFWQSKIAESGFSYAPRAGDGLTGVERPLYDRIVVDFGNSPESQRLYAGKTARESANVVYNYCFGRDAEIDPITGQNYWVGKLERKEITLSQLAAEVALGAQGQDLTFFKNRIQSADAFFSAMDTPVEQAGYSTETDASLAGNWLTQFGGTTATASQADQIMSTIVATF